MQTGPKTQLANLLLNEDVRTWATRHRNEERSWQWISRKLHAVTDGQVSLSRTWLSQLCEPVTDSGGAVPPHDRRTA